MEFSDRILYSKDVILFKNDEGKLKGPKFIDVITCPAPSIPVDKGVLEKRIDGILKVAAIEGKKELVLGNWGCGAYG